MLELAHFVLEVTGSASDIVFKPLPTDDPTRRCPDITLARLGVGLEPTTGLHEGIERTIEYFALIVDLMTEPHMTENDVLP